MGHSIFHPYVGEDILGVYRFNFQGGREIVITYSLIFALKYIHFQRVIEFKGILQALRAYKFNIFQGLQIKENRTPPPIWLKNGMAQ